MRSIMICTIACVCATGCASDGKPGFSSVPEALNFIVDCVEQDDVKRLAAACVGRGERPANLAQNPRVFNNLVAFHKSRGLMKSYGNKSFPDKDLVFKLGGHGKQFQHLHIDFIKKDQKWYLADIWNCR